MRIRFKIPVFFIGLLLISTIVLVALASNQMQSALLEEAKNKLDLSRVAKSIEVRNYFSALDDNLLLIASNPNTVGALTDLNDAWLDMGDNQTEQLQDLYIHQNQFGPGKRQMLDAAPDDSYYSSVHAVFHPWFRSLQKARGLYDVFLFDLDGNLVYSVSKETDFATNFLQGQWKDSGLGSVYRTVLQSNNPEYVGFSDFAPYGPSEGAPASFLARAVFDADGTMIGVMAYQLPLDQLNVTMTQRAGMGETGETYLVGPDRLMRTDSRFSEKSAVLRQRVDTEAARKAIAGKPGVEVIENYTGTTVVSSFQPIDFRGTRWGLIAEISEAELRSLIEQKIWVVFLTSLGVILVLGAAGYVIGARLVTPISNISDVAGALANGQLETAIPYGNNKDEVGELAVSISKFRDSVLEAIQLREDAEEADRARQIAEQNAKEEQRQRAAERERQQIEHDRQLIEQQHMERSKMADQFEAAVASIITDVMEKAELLKQSANLVDQSARDTAQRSSESYKDSQEAGTSVNSVAGSAAGMSQAIEEINARVQQASDNTRSANTAAADAVGQVDLLDGVAQKVGAVVKLINDIAEQTNLLALNATIEAARAGDAGKGFAVVASEVKSLANQTASATHEIEQQIDEMLAATQNATTSVRGVTSKISLIDEIAAEISSAVQQQSSETSEIGRAAAVAAEMTNRVADSIDAVGLAARANASTMSSVEEAASELLELAVGLDGQVKEFVAEMRS